MDAILTAAAPYEPSDHLVWVITGTDDFAQPVDERRVELMRCSRISPRRTTSHQGDFAFSVEEGASHDGVAATEYTYKTTGCGGSGARAAPAAHQLPVGVVGGFHRHDRQPTTARAAPVAPDPVPLRLRPSSVRRSRPFPRAASHRFRNAGTTRPG